MNLEFNKKLIIITITVLSVVLAIVSSFATYMGEAVSELTFFIWSAVFSLMIAFWSNLDANARNLYKPFEYSYLVFIFWPVVLPYHLITTRGCEGFLMFTGITGLYLLPFFCELVIWANFVQ